MFMCPQFLLKKTFSSPGIRLGLGLWLGPGLGLGLALELRLWLGLGLHNWLNAQRIWSNQMCLTLTLTRCKPTTSGLTINQSYVFGFSFRVPFTTASVVHTISSLLLPYIITVAHCKFLENSKQQINLLQTTTLDRRLAGGQLNVCKCV